MFDAAVIGGGLAGCSAAVALARQNRRVVLLEAGTYPRPKVCGEFLSPESVALFAESGFIDRLRALKPVTIRTLRLTAPDGTAWRSAFPAPALGISRYALDEALARYAAESGVDVRENARVTRIDGDLRAGFTLTVQSGGASHTIEASSVIGAHGRRSSIDRMLDRDFLRQPQPYMGLKQHFRGPPLPQHIDLHVFRGGYCGMSEVEDGTTNVCLLVRKDVFREAAGTSGDAVERFITWMCGQNPHLGAWLAKASPVYPEWLSIAQVTLASKTPLEGDMLLAGDYAGMIAPLAGDGMAMALHAGSLAAAAIDRFLSGSQDAQTMKRDYARQWRQTFGARMKLGRALQNVMLRPRLLTPGLHLLNRFPAIGHWLVQHTRDLRLLEQPI